jgi:hypothetical protein
MMAYALCVIVVIPEYVPYPTPTSFDEDIHWLKFMEYIHLIYFHS